MARLPRLVVAGQSHLVVQRGHSGSAVFVDDEDRTGYLTALRSVAVAEQVQVHAVALRDTEVLLLLTPATATGLSRLMQAVGRRHVAAHNRRHNRSGTLWDGRFRCGVVEAGHWRLQALCWVDTAGGPKSISAQHRLGGVRDPLLIDPPEYWQMGNTPFEREAAYRSLLADGLAASVEQALRRAALGGWGAGSPAFLAELETTASRATQPRPRGRPRLRTTTG